jgi:hypothetical protein
MRAQGRAAGFALLLSVLAGVPGCAVIQDVGSPTPAAERAPAAERPVAASASEVDRLRERAAGFWAARVAGDPNAQWEFLEPRGRGRFTPLEYVPGPGAMKYLAYQVEDATVSGYFADVSVRLLVQPILPAARKQKIGPSSTVVQDRWVRIGGTWYRSLEQEGS